MSTVKFAPDRARLRADVTGGDEEADNVCHSLCLATLVRYRRSPDHVRRQRLPLASLNLTFSYDRPTSIVPKVANCSGSGIKVRKPYMTFSETVSLKIRPALGVGQGDVEGLFALNWGV